MDTDEALVESINAGMMNSVHMDNPTPSCRWASNTAQPTFAIGVDLGKNSFHLIGLDQRGAIVWQLQCSRAQLQRRLANIPICLVGM